MQASPLQVPLFIEEAEEVTALGTRRWVFAVRVGEARTELARSGALGNKKQAKQAAAAAGLQVRKTPCRPRSWANFSPL